MLEYISREAAKCIVDDIDTWASGWRDYAKIQMDSLPTADVAPVVRGRWRSRFYYRESTKAYDCEMHVCSECGREWSYDAETGASDFNFCPNCGAKMEGEA